MYSWEYRPGVWTDGTFPGCGMRCRSRVDEKQGHLILRSFIVDEEQGHLAVDIAFCGGRAGLRMVSTGEPFFDGMKGFAGSPAV